jgi:tRNA/tmRNA/rRNA uracil-C5-methylase (TrmA/RlmC/RlmD family)
MKPIAANNALPLSHFFEANTTLETLPYEQESTHKQNALEAWWKHHQLPAYAPQIQRSKQPRHYRSTSKRRVLWAGHGPCLVHPGQNRAPIMGVSPSALEPEHHYEIFLQVHGWLNGLGKRIAQHLNWIILRECSKGTYLILNFHQMNAQISRYLQNSLKILADLKIMGAGWLYDPTQSDYYLDFQGGKETSIQHKHLFGARHLRLDACEKTWFYHPFSFSQIHMGMIPELLASVSELIGPDKSKNLLELYCGYGLFSFYLQDKVRSVAAWDWEGFSINCARESTQRQNLKNIRFGAAEINHSWMSQFLSSQNTDWQTVLLDPPRKGCASGVIAQLANRKIPTAVHMFCGSEVIPPEWEQWMRKGYKPTQTIAIDLFPGTPHLEIITQWQL